jgi:hypothetical protein
MYLNVQESQVLRYFTFEKGYLVCKLGEDCDGKWKADNLLTVLSRAVTHIEEHEPEDPKPKPKQKKTDPKSDAIDEKEVTAP